MKKLIPVALVMMILTSGLLASTAQAATAEDCQALIAQTSSDLGAVTIGGNNSDRTRASLESKLVGASIKLDEGKTLDAIDKLVDFRTAVEGMAEAAKPKISSEDAALLITDADNAIACIQSVNHGT